MTPTPTPKMEIGDAVPLAQLFGAGGAGVAELLHASVHARAKHLPPPADGAAVVAAVLLHANAGAAPNAGKHAAKNARKRANAAAKKKAATADAEVTAAGAAGGMVIGDAPAVAAINAADSALAAGAVAAPAPVPTPAAAPVLSVVPGDSTGASAAGAGAGAAAATAKVAVADAVDVKQPHQVPVKPAAGGVVWADAERSAAAVKRQTSPVSIAVVDLFAPAHVYPTGQLMDYAPRPGTNTARTGAEEMRARARDAVHAEMYADVRQAAEVHRHVRLDVRKWLKPGLSMIDIAHRIENGTKALLKYDAYGDRQKCGWGFPTGLSLNHVAAHYTPNYGDKTILQKGDVLKIDIGTHVNGRIVDSAFTIAFEPQYDPLLEAVRAATEAGVAAAGIDVRLCDVGAAVQEVMESYEVTIGKKTYPVRVVRGLYGHSIEQHRIHGSKSVPTVKNHDTTRMEEGEFFAIETFGSTGRGHTIEDGECSHYMRNYRSPQAMNVNPKTLRLAKARELLQHIEKHHGTLAFCRRWIDDEGQKAYLMGLKSLVQNDIIHAVPPLCDVKGCYTAQFEHTILLRPTCKEVISRGIDY